MKSNPSTIPATLEQVEREVSRRRTAAQTAMKCLIASVSRTRRNLMTAAAEAASWEPVVCSTAQEALTHVQKHLVHLAMVDLDDHGETAAGMRELVESLASSSELLLSVCGHEADPDEEIWVRQLGIWLYLPGITNSTEVSMLCEQAMLVIEQQQSKTELPVS